MKVKVTKKTINKKHKVIPKPYYECPHCGYQDDIGGPCPSCEYTGNYSEMACNLNRNVFVVNKDFLNRITKMSHSDIAASIERIKKYIKEE